MSREKIPQEKLKKSNRDKEKKSREDSLPTLVDSARAKIAVTPPLANRQLRA